MLKSISTLEGGLIINFQKMNSILDLVNKRSLKKSIPDIATGDVVKVSQKITEGAKTRVQVFEGMVIARSGGDGVTASITVRKIASGVGVEKKFILNSPNIESIKVLRSSKVRRKKIFFLRGLTGKAAKIKEKQRKMMAEIGLQEDEVETAENTQELAQPIETEEVAGEDVKEEAVVEKEEPVVEDKPVEETQENAEAPKEESKEEEPVEEPKNEEAKE